MQQRHRYIIYASYCFFIMAVIGPVKYFFVPIEMFYRNWGWILFNLAVFAGLGILVRQGFSWMKYVMAVLAALGVLGLLRQGPILTTLIKHSDPLSLNGFVDLLLIIAVTILLFSVPPKPAALNTSNEEPHEKRI